MYVREGHSDWLLIVALQTCVEVVYNTNHAFCTANDYLSNQGVGANCSFPHRMLNLHATCPHL